jgi:hypothetical protein
MSMLTCMRCGEVAEMRFAGTCPSCVETLHAKFPHVARDVEAESYTPKMNVTPNAVALKDD